MSILTWMVFGLVVGAIANILDPRPSEGGLLGAVVLGIVGAMVGGFLGSLFFGANISGFNSTSMFVAILGSLLLLSTGRVLTRV